MMDYTKEQLEEVLRNNIIEVKFEKVDGTQSSMICTLKKDLLPIQGDVKTDEIQKKPKKEPNPNVISVWNVDKKAWRSFRIANIIEPVRIIDNPEEYGKYESSNISPET